MGLPSPKLFGRDDRQTLVHHTRDHRVVGQGATPAINRANLYLPWSDQSLNNPW
jgi:hypothetical protein